MKSRLARALMSGLVSRFGRMLRSRMARALRSRLVRAFGLGFVLYPDHKSHGLVDPKNGQLGACRGCQGDLQDSCTAYAAWFDF